MTREACPGFGGLPVARFGNVVHASLVAKGHSIMIATLADEKSAVGECDDAQAREIELRMEIGNAVAAD